MEKIDYLIVAENATLGQVEYTKQRKRMLDDLGYSSEVIFFQSPKIRLALDFLRVAYIYKKKLEGYLQNTKTDFIEFCFPATVILQNPKKLKKYKKIISFDLPFGVNIHHFGSSILHNLEERKYHSANKIISWTGHGKKFLVEKYDVEENKIIQIPYALNPLEINRFKISDEDYAVSYCSETMWKKGLDILINAWNIIDGNRKLLVIGISERNALRYLTQKKIEVPTNIEFIEQMKREMFLKTLSKSSFLISSGRMEEFGIVVLEALGFRKPVVSTPTIGPRELLWEIDKKLISPSFSPKDLAEAIINLEDLNLQRIKKKIAKVIRNFEYDKVKERFKEEIIDKHG
jgi:glycosyltransferase involved in cell wall biosynthesis